MDNQDDITYYQDWIANRKKQAQLVSKSPSVLKPPPLFPSPDITLEQYKPIEPRPEPEVPILKLSSDIGERVLPELLRGLDIAMTPWKLLEIPIKTAGGLYKGESLGEAGKKGLAGFSESVLRPIPKTETSIAGRAEAKLTELPKQQDWPNILLGKGWSPTTAAFAGTTIEQLPYLLTLSPEKAVSFLRENVHLTKNIGSELKNLAITLAKNSDTQGLRKFNDWVKGLNEYRIKGETILAKGLAPEGAVVDKAFLKQGGIKNPPISPEVPSVLAQPSGEIVLRKEFLARQKAIINNLTKRNAKLKGKEALKASISRDISLGLTDTAQTKLNQWVNELGRGVSRLKGEKWVMRHPKTIRLPADSQELTLIMRPVFGNFQPSTYRSIIDSGRRLFLNSTTGVLKRMGNSGSKLADSLDGIYQTSRLRSAGWKADIKGLPKLSNNELYNFADVADGRAMSMNSNVANFVNIWKKHQQTIGQEAKNMSIIVKTSEGDRLLFNPMKDYYPHWIPVRALKNGETWAIKEATQTTVARGWAQTPEEAQGLVNDWVEYLNSNGNSEKFLRSLVGKGQAGSVSEAKAIMDRYVWGKSPKKFGHLERAREIDLPFYVRDPRLVLPRFYDGMARRIEEIKAFGQNNDILYKLLDNIGREGGDMAFAKRAANFILGKAPESDSVISKALTWAQDFQVVSKMGLSALTNATQHTNILARFNAKTFLQGCYDARTKEGIDFAMRAGVNIGDISRDLLETISSGKAAGKFLKWSGFNAVESLNRIVSANTAKHYALDLFDGLLKNPTSKFRTRRLLDLIPDLNIREALTRGSLSQEELIKATYKGIHDTQYSYRVLDLPLYWRDNAWGRLITQFKAFGFQQANYVKKYILGEAIKGNFKPLMYYVTASEAAGEAVQDIRSLITGRERPDSPAKRALDNFLLVGAVGIFSDSIQAAYWGSKSFYNYVFGPTMGDILDIPTLVVKGQGRQLARETIQKIPGIAGKIYPPAGFPVALLEKSITPRLIPYKGKKKALTPDERYLEEWRKGNK